MFGSLPISHDHKLYYSKVFQRKLQIPARIADEVKLDKLDPPPSHSLESGVPMLVPHHMTSPPPPISGQKYTPLSPELVVPLRFTKTKQKNSFPGFSGKPSRDKRPKIYLSRENIGIRICPLCVRGGGTSTPTLEYLQ